MGEVEKKDLGEVGRTYVREYLRDINVFCAALLETFDSSPGEVFTYAPADTSHDRLSKFEWGGLLPENLENAGAVALADGSTLAPVFSLVEKQVKLLRETMERAGAVCIVDDLNPRWSERPSWLGPTAFGVGIAGQQLPFRALSGHLSQMDAGAMFDVDPDQLREAVESQHGGKAIFLQAVPVRDEFEGQTAWEGVVHIFNLHRHPTADRAYAWSTVIDEATRRRCFYAVLHGGPVKSPLDAVRAAIVAEHRSAE